MNGEELLEGARELGIRLIPEQVESFRRYQEKLEEENRRLNLTAIKSGETVKLHFLDSLAGAGWLPRESSLTLLDVGSGAGFPGIPLKIYQPHIRLHILESSKKRIAFLEGLVQELGLKGVELFHGRAEDFGRRRGFRDAYPWVAARALAPLNVLLELCLPFCREGGVFCAYKGPQGGEELAESRYALKILGGRLLRQHHFPLPQGGAKRSLLLFVKDAPTPTAYPRRPGIPAKRPLGKKNPAEGRKFNTNVENF